MSFRCSLHFAASIVVALVALVLPTKPAFTQEGIPTFHYAIFHTFSGPDGSSPSGQIVRDQSGIYYGVTEMGGAFGEGVVFKMDIHGTETVLHSFAGAPADGANPQGTLARDSAGNLYGITTNGGKGKVGVVFKIDTLGTETILHNFGLGSDGAGPAAGPILDSAGNLYGTTERAGSFGAGTIYRITPSGSYSVLHNFKGGDDGSAPQGTLLRDSSGNLFGTTSAGGSHGSGVIFKVTASGTESVLYSFSGGQRRRCATGQSGFRCSEQPVRDGNSGREPEPGSCLRVLCQRRFFRPSQFQ